MLTGARVHDAAMQTSKLGGREVPGAAKAKASTGTLGSAVLKWKVIQPYGGGLGLAPSHAGPSNKLCLGGCAQGWSVGAGSQRSEACRSVDVSAEGRTCSAGSGGTQEARKGIASLVKDAPRAMPGTSWRERKL